MKPQYLKESFKKNDLENANERRIPKKQRAKTAIKYFGIPSLVFQKICNSYFPATIMECNELDVKLRKSKSLPYFGNALLKVGWPTVTNL